jgi:hypothetical protein
MWLAFAAGGLIGMLLGFWFRVPALIVASAVAAVIIVVAAPFNGFGPMLTVGTTFAFLAVLQLGYFAGLMLSCAWARSKLSSRDRHMLSSGELLGQGRVRVR